MDLKSLKQELFQHCIHFVDQRIENAKSALSAAQEAANSEEKSSAGDKYETGRAMAQLEQEKATQQLEEAIRLKSTLLKINPEFSSPKASLGSVLLTDRTHFFIAISAGKMEVKGQSFFVVAPHTPIGKNLIGLEKGSSFEFNNHLHRVIEIL
jgi:transcription elongation GreA/GreB family factor